MIPSKAQPSIESNQHPPDEAPVGVGLRSHYYREMLDTKPPIGWIEVHPENYFGGGAHRHYLLEARKLWPLSFHAVGLSLGSSERVSHKHLNHIKELIDIYEPFHISDHDVEHEWKRASERFIAIAL